MPRQTKSGQEHPAGKAKPDLRVALALGGGGARGLSHLIVLEALEQAGVTPIAIAGTSIGAILGAAFAAGKSAKSLRSHTLELFRDRPDVMTRLFRSRVGRLSDLFAGGTLGNPVLLDAERLLAEFWPRDLPSLFEDLAIPFTAIATDYGARSRLALRSGPLRPAVAASMAIPGLCRPVRLDGRLLIDGGAVDPVPFDELPAAADIIIAVDVTGGPTVTEEGQFPSALEATLGASQIMQSAILLSRLSHERLRNPPSRIRLLQPAVGAFGALDFFAARKILSAAEHLHDEVLAALQPAQPG